MLKYPIDKDGFAVPVSMDKLLNTMKTYNIAVVKVLDDDECRKSVDAMWSDMNISGLLR